MKKKIIAIAACMCLSLGAFSAVYAAEGDPQSGSILQDEQESPFAESESAGEDAIVPEVPPAEEPEVTEEPDATEEPDVTEEPEETGDADVIPVPVPDSGLDGNSAAFADATQNTAALTGWQKVGEDWLYYGTTPGEEPVKGLQQDINGKTYFFDDAGILQTGFQTVNGTKYYFNPNGEEPSLGLGAMMKSVWVTEANKYYYLGEDGVPVSGEIKLIGSKRYAFDAEGRLLTGWQTIGKNNYYFQIGGDIGAKGQMYTGWKAMNGKIYYFQVGNADGNIGKLYTGWKAMNGKRYYFQVGGDAGAKGQMYTGWRTIGKNVYYLQMGGNIGEKGQLYTGFKTLNQKVFYFQKGNSDGNIGKMYTSWRTIDGQVFYFQQGGVKGVQGQMYTGWRGISGKVFYFKPTGAYGSKGARLTGWQTIGNKRFFFQRAGVVGNAGRLLTGWQNIDGKKYYLQETGAYGTKGQMAKNGWLKISNTWYYFQSNGSVKTGWLRDGSQWYYLKSNGAMVTGWNYVDSYKYYFRPNSSGGPQGSLVQDVSSMVSGPYYATVDRVRNVVTIYAKDESGNYRIPVKAMTCSVGLPGPDTATPVGNFNTIGEPYRWKALMGNSWGQYATRIVGGVLFHSVAGSAPNPYSLPAAEYNRLGSPASHGCVRLCVRDAKWIYDNCQRSMPVTIGDNLYQPFDKPATIKIPPTQNWDPTDPNI